MLFVIHLAIRMMDGNPVANNRNGCHKHTYLHIPAKSRDISCHLDNNKTLPSQTPITGTKISVVPQIVIQQPAARLHPRSSESHPSHHIHLLPDLLPRSWQTTTKWVKNQEASAGKRDWQAREIGRQEATADTWLRKMRGNSNGGDARMLQMGRTMAVLADKTSN